MKRGASHMNSLTCHTLRACDLPVTWQVSTVFQGFNSLSRPSQLHATFMLCLTCFEVLLFFASWQYLLDSMLMTVCLAPLTSPDVVS